MGRWDSEEGAASTFPASPEAALGLLAVTQISNGKSRRAVPSASSLEVARRDWCKQRGRNRSAPSS